VAYEDLPVELRGPVPVLDEGPTGSAAGFELLERRIYAVPEVGRHVEGLFEQDGRVGADPDDLSDHLADVLG
jgi:hypothetical protein